MSKFTEAYGKLKTFITEFSTQQLTSLNGILDKVPDGMKKDFTVMRDALQAKKAEIDALLAAAPDEAEPATALQSFFEGFTKLRAHTDGLMSSLQSALTEHAKTTTALQGLEKQVADGDLLAKGKVKDLTERAKQDGVDSVMPQLTALRQSAIALAGLPDTAPAALLALPADQFDAALKVAQANVKTLTDEFGFALQGKGDAWVKECAFQDATAFQGSVTKIKALLPEKKGGSGDPLLGSQGAHGAPTGKLKFA